MAIINLPVFNEKTQEKFGTVEYDTETDQFVPASYAAALQRAGASTETHELDVQGNTVNGDVACVLPLS